MNAQGPSLLDEVAAFIADNELLAEDTRVVTGVSGGADSMALLDILHRLGYGVVAVHVELTGTVRRTSIRQMCTL
ncbi:MAG: hypothetical protein ACOCTG_04750 [Bacteroidota bacterium]